MFSELWTVTKSLENEIDVFQRNLLRKILKIRYPYTISNVDLYERTKETQWSKKLKTRRLSWTGHLLRLDENTPAHKALNEAKNKCKIYKRSSRKNWIHVVNEDFESLKVGLSMADVEARNLALDREWWRNKVVAASRAESTNGRMAPQ